MKNLTLLLFVFFSFSALSHTLTVKIDHLPSHEGSIFFALFNKKDGFPNDGKQAYRNGSVKAQDEKMTFTDLPEGTYVLSVFHDENENGKLDTILGIPKEAFGFSNNPRILFGPPSYKECTFSVSHDRDITITMKDL